MKILKSGAILLSAALASQAALVSFNISPLGSDAAVGLSPANEVPPVVNSTGSGGAISGGIVFDTDTSLLHLAIGYGSAAGFTDLTGPPIAVSLNGPAPTGQVAAVLYDLSTNNFLAPNPTNGGVIFGSIAYPTNAVPNLLAGLNYVNLATLANPDGEIRGQLVPVTPPNVAPVVSCPGAATVECGTPAEVRITVNDPDGDALTVVWAVNGSAVQTNNVPASNPPATNNVSLIADLPLGTNIVGVTVTDSAGNVASCSTTITVVDTTPPVIQAASVQPAILWSPNHKMVTVTVSARVTDSCGPTSWRIIGVRSNEPENGLGDGDTAPDWTITGDNTASLRSERSGTGTGRIYTIAIQASDQSGNLSAPKTVIVTVPKSQGSGRSR